MFPQEHNSVIIGSDLEQMLQQFPYAPMPINPNPIMDRSITSSTRWKPSIEVAPNCPRCASTNTKFCYYNNYSLSQPRYFCKGCRRYWTKGGSLRNVPVGGGCRKNRRGKAARHSHQSERPSTNIGNSDDRESSAGDGDQGSENNNGSRDIDMAVVFAKFLNQKPSSNNHEEYGSSSSNNLSNSNLTTPESGENIEKDAVVQPQKGREFDPVVVAAADSDIDGDDPLGLLGGIHVEGTMENFIDELEVFDGVVQDVVWCDDAAVTCCWQPPPPLPPPTMMQMQLQELEAEYSVEPLLNNRELMLPISTSNNSMDLISDGWSTNWGSFDLSTMEVFSSSSRP